MRRLFVIIGIVTLSLGLIGCTNENVTTEDGKDKVVDDNSDDSSDLLQLTLAELSEFDGQDGNNAYIAVDGIIYDVTNVSQWSEGSHNGLQAGQDLTEEINNLSPHGTSVLDNLDIVGELVE
ncbi:MAG: cytochrome b5 domain-containing protein [Candidatus Izemoplasma sp.]|nr:cytochrome b5 domain-containing protein [Candidatus Izemoplasma sp.]